jgi:hypothetical protein
MKPAKRGRAQKAGAEEQQEGAQAAAAAVAAEGRQQQVAQPEAAQEEAAAAAVEGQAFGCSKCRWLAKGCKACRAAGPQAGKGRA